MVLLGDVRLGSVLSRLFGPGWLVRLLALPALLRLQLLNFGLELEIPLLIFPNRGKKACKVFLPELVDKGDDLVEVVEDQLAVGDGRQLGRKGFPGGTGEVGILLADVVDEELAEGVWGQAGWVVGGFRLDVVVVGQLTRGGGKAGRVDAMGGDHSEEEVGFDGKVGVEVHAPESFAPALERAAGPREEMDGRHGLRREWSLVG